jgi:AraC-like DNA-binding protein
MSRSILIKSTGDVKLFGVRFHPAGAFPLVRFTLSEITDRIVDFVDACPAGRRVEGKINEARSFTDRVACFEEFFYREIAVPNDRDYIAVHAAELIVAGKGLESISSIAVQVGASNRRLERRFKHVVGISPKTFSRIVRFQAVVNSIQSSDAAGLLDTALTFGYYDQSHLIRDFNEFSGATPVSYFERTHQISDVFTGAV